MEDEQRTDMEENVEKLISSFWKRDKCIHNGYVKYLVSFWINFKEQCVCHEGLFFYTEVVLIPLGSQ